MAFVAIDEKAAGPMRSIVLVATLLLLPAGVQAELMKCRQPSGTIYVGSSPPPDCGPVSNVRERGPVDFEVSNERVGEREKPRVSPTPYPNRENRL